MEINKSGLNGEMYFKIRRSMFNTSAITPANRLKVRRLLFEDQAKLIGMYAHAQLKRVDDLISTRISGEKLTAAYLWFRLRANAAENTTIDLERDSQAIKTLYPRLANVSTQISQIFNNAFTYWVDNYYSCDRNGKPNFFACLNSKARNLEGDEMQRIDDVSDMAYLGRSMKNYADHLLLKNFPQSYMG